LLDILVSLETSQCSDPWDARLKGLSLPVADGSLVQDIENLSLSPGLLKNKTALGGILQTASLACRLLDAFNPKGGMQPRAKHQEFIFRQNFSWMLNGFHRLRKVIIQWLQMTGAQTTPEDERVLLQYLTYLHRCSSPESTLAGLLSHMSVISTWSQCLCGFIGLESIDRLPSVQAILSRFLDDLSQVAQSSQSLVPQMREILLPALTEVKDSKPLFQSFKPCLQVKIFIVSNKPR
jgi:serine/threonine-protein kinase ATR